MPNSSTGKATENQIALPTDQLFETIKTYFNNGEHSQMQKALEVGSYFLSGCMAVNISQFLGAPLYLINQDWYNAWIALTKQSFGLLTTTLTQYWAPTVVRVSGDQSVRGQLAATPNGGLRCLFPQRMVLIANHQIYTDWLYLWWIAYCNGMHGHIFIVLKESLKKIPVLGWGMQLSQFIFLKRNWEQDKPQMAKHFQKLNKMSLPMWLLIFPEGTNLAQSTRERSAQWAKKSGIEDLQHTLLPRSTGLRFSLQQMRKTVKYVYDCTIAYEGVPRGQYAQDIFTFRTAYFEGKPPKSVNMHWRRFALSSIPIDDPVAFEVWLRARWMEKDALIEAYYRHGRFPADRGAHKNPQGRIIRGAGHIETEIKSNYWYEFLQIFAPVGLLALVLYVFYNALPPAYTEPLNRQNVAKKADELRSAQANLQKQQLLSNSSRDISADQDSVMARAMEIYTALSKNPAVRNIVELPDLTPKGFKEQMAKLQPAVDTIFTQKNALQDLQTQLQPRALLPSSQKPGGVDKQPVPQRSESKQVKFLANQPAKNGLAATQGRNGVSTSGGTKQLKAPKSGLKNPETKKSDSTNARGIAPHSITGNQTQLNVPKQKVAPVQPPSQAQKLRINPHKPTSAKTSTVKPITGKTTEENAAKNLPQKVSARHDK